MLKCFWTLPIVLLVGFVLAVWLQRRQPDPDPVVTD